MPSETFNTAFIDDTPLDIIQSLRIGIDVAIPRRDLAISLDQLDNGRLQFESKYFDGCIAVKPSKIIAENGRRKYDIVVSINNDALTDRTKILNTLDSMFKHMVGAEFFNCANQTIRKKMENVVFKNATATIALSIEQGIRLKAGLSVYAKRGQHGISSVLKT
jgi:hypothetical protein